MLSWRLLLVLVLAVVLVFVPQTPYGTKNNLTLMITLFTVASMASSWNILAGLAGQINLGHAAFFGIGSLVTRHLWLEEAMNFELAFLGGGAAAAATAAVVGAPALRLKGIYFSVGTLALAEVSRLTVASALPQISRLPASALRTYDILPRYYLALGVMLGVIVTVLWLMNSRLGLGLMAIREDPEAARSIGINVFAHNMLAFVVSAFFAGLAGASFAYFHLAYYPTLAFTPIWTFDALLVTFIGGIGTLSGPLVGAVFFVYTRDVLADQYVNIHPIIFGSIFIIVVLALPGGFVDISTRAARWLARRTKS